MLNEKLKFYPNSPNFLDDKFKEYRVLYQEFYRIPISVFKEHIDYFTSLYSLTDNNKNLLIFNFTDDIIPEEKEPQVVIFNITNQDIIDEIYPR